MNEQDFILYIILRGSLQIDNDHIIYYVADAIQHIMLKYFTLQVLSVKANCKFDENLSNTTKWLANNSKKHVAIVSDDIWNKIKNDFNTGKDIFSLKNDILLEKNVETTLVLWPTQCSNIPNYLK